MNMKLMKKIWSAVLALTMIVTMSGIMPVSAAKDNIELIFKDITAEDTTTLEGETKVKVSVKGAGGSVSIAQVALQFDGDLKFKSIDYLKGENNPPSCFLMPVDVALTNKNKELMPSIIAPLEPLSFSEEETDLFILTFAGEPGESANVKLSDKETATYFEFDTKETSYIEDDINIDVTASSEANKGVEAVVRVVMDKVEIPYGKESGITLTITRVNEETGRESVISNVLNTEFHYDSSSTDVLAFEIENTLIDGVPYKVELSGAGYITYVAENVIFKNGEPVVITNSDFVPGDVNGDGVIDYEDKKIYKIVTGADFEDATDLDDDGEISDSEKEAYRKGYEADYMGSLDFNRDGVIDARDDVFSLIQDAEEDEEEKKTAPEKMKKPDVSGGAKRIIVEWKAPKDGGSAITGYIIKFGTDEDDLDKKVEIKDKDATKETLKDLAAGKKYYVQIAAVNEIGTGEFSDIANATTDKATSDNGSGGGGGGGGGGSTGGSGGMTSLPITGTQNPTTPAEAFIDLANHAWAKDSIYELKDKGIISGVSATEFAPANNIKRGDFILILVRMLGIDNEFTENFMDVPADKYYYDAIGKAKAAGIATGDGINFMPENSITRQDLITLAYRAFLNLGYITEAEDISALDAFADKAMISEYAQKAMASMVSAGIIKGSDGNVNPLGNATRAEVAVMCARLLNLMK